MRKILSIMLTGSILFASLIPSKTVIVHANESDEQQIKTVINSFFYTYENIDGDKSIEQIVEGLEDLSSTNLSSYDSNYLEMAELLLQRKKIILDTAEHDISKYSKKIEITTEEMDIRGNNASVGVTILQTWNYAFSPDIESGAEDDYTMYLKKEETEWKIDTVKGLCDSTMEKAVNNMGDEISDKERNAYINNIEKEYAYSLGYSIPKEKKISKVEPFSIEDIERAANYTRSSAVQYARKHALSPSSSYYYFEDHDCTNFTSQCLYAGGIKQHKGTAYSENCWYYNTSTDRSSSWTGAAEFYRYINGNNSKISKTSSNFNSVKKGDIIQLMEGGSAYHSLIVTDIVTDSSGKRTDLLVCCHSDNRKDASLKGEFGGITKKYHNITGNK